MTPGRGFGRLDRLLPSIAATANGDRPCIPKRLPVNKQ